jgi:hypothetical protein
MRIDDQRRSRAARWTDDLLRHVYLLGCFVRMHWNIADHENYLVGTVANLPASRNTLRASPRLYAKLSLGLRGPVAIVVQEGD